MHKIVMKFGAYVLIYLNAKLLDDLIVFYVIKIE